MGREASCTVFYEGRQAEGKARLEHDRLTFRGDFRLSIPFTEVKSVEASEGMLRVAFGGRTATFGLGSAAGKWAQSITHPKSRLDKLGIKPGQRITVLGRIDSALRAFIVEIQERAVDVRQRARRNSDIIFLAANDARELERLKSLKQDLKPAGAIWVVRPKGVTAITESQVMRAGKDAGLVDVKVVSFSDTHTAEKFVIPVARRQS